MRWLRMALISAATLAFATACAPPASPHAVVPPPADATATPESLAAAIFDLLRQEKAAIAQSDQKGASAVRDELMKLVDAEEMNRTFSRQLGFKPLLGDEPAAGYVKLWAAQVGSYLDAIAIGEARHAPGSDATHATLLIPARKGTSDALIVLRCVRRTDGRWLATRLDFDDPTRAAAASAPVASQPPASRP
jgi:hypothetical protein